MAWSFSIGSLRGTEVRVHWTFILFLAWIAVAFYVQGGLAAAAGTVVFFLLLFVCVVLHEFGHVFMARHFGVPTPDILLLPIGGVSRLERIPDEPRQELFIALAGPMVSLVIAAALVVALGGLPNPLRLWSTDPMRSVAAQLAWANLVILAFNLLPAFPMDGGRVLRALLSSRLGHGRATRIAAIIGQGAAIALGLAALLMGHVLLALIALFIWFAAGAEAGLAQMRSSMTGLPAGDVMITDFEALAPDVPVAAAAEALIRTTQREFPVLDEAGRLRGFLTRDGIIKALRERGPHSAVAEAMQIGIPEVTSRHHLDEPIRLIHQGAPAVAVNDAAGRFAGYITMENLVEQLMISRTER